MKQNLQTTTITPNPSRIKSQTTQNDLTFSRKDNLFKGEEKYV